jgi:hypothetical protein
MNRVIVRVGAEKQAIVSTRDNEHNSEYGNLSC